ncbi:MAG: hypothetical protein PHZ02_14705 [Desulfocapsaceae bacterium]|jgi:hypothetical protein|nr:hypothetical protein [Desulfocapsaceae bacterium]
MLIGVMSFDMKTNRQRDGGLPFGDNLKTENILQLYASFFQLACGRSEIPVSEKS